MRLPAPALKSNNHCQAGARRARHRREGHRARAAHRRRRGDLHGLRKSADYIARVAIDEGVDAVGLSILSGSHVELVGQVLEQLRAANADDVKVFVGGTIPAEDHASLPALGVRGVYTADMPLADVVGAVAKELAS